MKKSEASVLLTWGGLLDLPLFAGMGIISTRDENYAQASVFKTMSLNVVHRIAP